MVRSGKCSKHSDSAKAVAARYQSRLPAGYKLTARSLYNAMATGRCGQPPGHGGVKSIIPQKLVEAVADFSSLKQTVGDEQQPRQLVRVAVASIKGTILDGFFDHPGRAERFLVRVRELSYISVAFREAVDDRRWQYPTTTNLSCWFKCYIDCLITHKFLPESARGMDMHSMSLEIARDLLRRMFNGDESHQKLSNEGEHKGSRSSVYINNLLARAGKRTATHQKHATILAWMNYAGEVGALHAMLATDAQAAKKGKAHGGKESDIRMKPEWTYGVPRVRGYFGHDTEQIFEPSFVMNEKGGMVGGGFEQFLDMQIFPAYPNMAPEWKFGEGADGERIVISGPVFGQFDAGPDRYTEISLTNRVETYQRGLICFPGLPNGTAGNQVADDLFGVYKAAVNAVMDNIVGEKIVAKQLISLGFTRLL